VGGVDVIESLFLFRPWLMCRHPLTVKPAEVLERNNPIQIGDQSGPKVPAALRTNDQRLGALTDPLDMRDLHRVSADRASISGFSEAELLSVGDGCHWCQPPGF